jgi:hypothetical protein
MGRMVVLDLARTLGQRVDGLRRAGSAHDYGAADGHSRSAVDATNGMTQPTQAS